MLARSIAAIVVAVSVSSTFANENALLHSYIQSQFPASLQLTPEQIEQLTWIIEHKNRSFDLDMCANNDVHIEVSRALTRLYCLQLLKNGGRTEYEHFVAAQLSNNIDEPLSFASFNLLALHVQQLSNEDFLLLQTAIILSAVSLSTPAANFAQRTLNLDDVGNDSLNFLAATVRSEVNIYPLTEHIVHDQTADKKLLYILFPPQTNLRHMLYAEGGVAMFRYLRTMIKHQYISQNELDLWFGYWIVNIAGFRGHIDQRGSIYLNESVFKAMYKLKENIYTILQQPNYDPLIPYLEYRAELLGLQHLPLQQRLTMAHMGAMLRLYTQAEGKQLLAGFNNLPQQLRLNIQRQYMHYLNDPTQVAPTHLPALFGNALQLCNGDIEQVLLKITPIYYQAIQKYTEQQKSHRLKANIVLAFNKLSASYNVQKILDSTSKINLQIMPDGEVLIL